DRRLTYRELDERANRLARHLVRHGAGRGQLIGLAVRRSLDMVVGILGILKAGGAYLPLDPDYPRDRLAFMIADASVRVLVTEADLASDLHAEGAEVIRFDADAEAIAEESPARLGATAE